MSHDIAIASETNITEMDTSGLAVVGLDMPGVGEECLTRNSPLDGRHERS
jgi:hypothetical protein